MLQPGFFFVTVLEQTYEKMSVSLGMDEKDTSIRRFCTKQFGQLKFVWCLLTLWANPCSQKNHLDFKHGAEIRNSQVC